MKLILPSDEQNKIQEVINIIEKYGLLDNNSKSYNITNFNSDF